MTTTKKAKMYEAIEKHGASLNRIFNTSLDNITLSKRLFSLEHKAHKLAEDYCNGVVDSEQADKLEAQIVIKLHKILGGDKKPLGLEIPVFVNMDARGYALKIDSEWMLQNAFNSGLHRDLGGYGILAPDFNESN